MAAAIEGEFVQSENAFSRGDPRTELDDEEALMWAALEKLPTHNRARTAILLKNLGPNGSLRLQEIDVKMLEFSDKRMLVEKLLSVSESNLFITRLRHRIDRVGIELPRIEVRFEGLNVEAGVHIGKRALPTLPNFTVNLVEQLLGKFHLKSSGKHNLKILRNVSGVLKPSRMTLLLGPPNSGKTTLLLALAGKLDKALKVSGSVTYNGHDMTEFVAARTSSYISQHDLHSGEMTVRETFDFAARCQGVGSRHEMIMELARREKNAQIKPDPEVDAFMKAAAVKGQENSIVTEYIIKILGLDICADTIVGDHMRRGISGGQRKRVTTGEMLVGPARALFMDEISTGLDSSTTYQIVNSLRNTVHALDATVLVSLLQPAPETYELFDDLILLSEGCVIYQGPRELVLDFFQTMGFRCPPRKGVADFLQEVTSRKDQEQYWMDKRRPYRFITPEEFAEAFNKFHIGQTINQELSTPFDKNQSHPAALVKQKYALGNVELIKALLSREILLMKRNSFFYIFKISQMFLLALVSATVFLRTKMHHRTERDGGLYMGALFFGLIVVMFNGLAELSMTIARLPVYYKQRDMMLFPAWAWSIPVMITRIPITFMQSGIWMITYYAIGFAPSPGRFFRQWLLLFLIGQMAAGLFRFIAALSRTMVVANTFGSFALLIVFALGGFVLSKDDIHSWWIWGYWTSPLMYGQNAIAVNEFTATRWQKVNGTSETIGNRILEARGLFTEGNWYWIAVGAQIGYIIFFNVVFTLALTYLKAPGGHQSVLLDEKDNEETMSSRAKSRRAHLTQRSFNDEDTQLQTKSEGDVKKGMVLPFQPLAMSFNNVNYYVDMPPAMKKDGVKESRLQLLHGVSSSFRPGILTALVGVSGAGKTTLMDVLAGRKTGGCIEGDIRISGYPKKQETFARISGYCEQNDIHSPQVTVHESLIYSAWLRLSSDIDKQTREMFVEEIMELVELTPLRNALVGMPGVNGLSTEQRKRLTIAVELVANPSIIFMDEPTSGLDARAAAIVMRTVRNTVDTGRTVVCTIHQPSIDIFEAFDELLLMKRGGRVIYAGSLGKDSKTMVDYFEAIPGVPQIKDGYNPATWVLEVSSIEMENRLEVDFADIYESSALHQQNQELIARLSIPPEGSKDISFPTQYPLSFWGQTQACLWKQRNSYWKHPYYVLVRMFFTVGVALLFGTMFWDIGSQRHRQQGLSNLMGSMYATILFIGVSNAQGIQPVVAAERTVYYRERAAGMYSPLPYAFGQVLIELPYVFVQAVSYGAIVYAMMQLEWTAAKFLYFVFFLFLTFLYFTFYGMMAVAATPNEQIGVIASSLFYSFWNLFSGFLIPRPSIPIWWRWYYWASPPAWSLYGIIASQLGDLDTPLKLNDGSPTTIKKFLREYYGYRHSFLGAVVGVHIGLVILFAFIFAFCIKRFNFQKR